MSEDVPEPDLLARPHWSRVDLDRLDKRELVALLAQRTDDVERLARALEVSLRRARVMRDELVAERTLKDELLKANQILVAAAYARRSP